MQEFGGNGEITPELLHRFHPLTEQKDMRVGD